MGKLSGACRVALLILLAVAWVPRDAAAQGQGALGVRVHDAPNGVAIDEVQPQSAAAKAGLRAGDVVVEFDGERVRSAQQFTRLVQETPAGREVAAVIQRDGATQKVQLTPEQRRMWPELQLRDDLRAFPGDRLPDGPRPFFWGPGANRTGTSLLPLDAQLAAYFGVKEGVLVSSVQPGSAAARAGLRAGDVIIAANGRPVRSPADVLATVAPGTSTTLELRVVREKRELTVSVRG